MGRTIARRNLCSHVSRSHTSRTLHALQPQGGHAGLLRCHQPRGGEPRGQRCEGAVKIVPAVTDVRRPHARHIHKFLAVRQNPPFPHARRTNPSGHPNGARWVTRPRRRGTAPPGPDAFADRPQPPANPRLLHSNCYLEHRYDSSGADRPPFDAFQGHPPGGQGGPRLVRLDPVPELAAVLRSQVSTPQPSPERTLHEPFQRGTRPQGL